MFQDNPFEDLAVLNIPSIIGKSQEINWDGKQDLFVPESCSRQLVIGTPNSFDRLPEGLAELVKGTNSVFDSDKRVSKSLAFATGEEAYTYLLRISCGLHSKKRPGESYFHGMIRKRWNEFSESHTELATSLRPAFQTLFKDIKFIRNKVLYELVASGRELEATRIAGVQLGQRVLLVAGKKGTTDLVARALGRPRKSYAGEIVLTHPEYSHLDESFNELRVASQRGIIRSELSRKSPGRVLKEGLDKFDHVFVCAQMERSIEFDRALIRAWNLSSRSESRLVHLTGHSKYKGLTGGLWSEQNLNGFVSPEDLRRRYKEVIDGNKAVLAAASRACRNCAASRAIGAKPISKALQDDPKDYKRLLEHSESSK